MWVWFGLAVVLLIVEIGTIELIAVWFAISALVMGLVVGFAPNLSIIWQIVIFVTLSAILVVLTRRFVRKMMKKRKNQETNLELVLNHTALVVENIDNRMEVGAVKINGLVWSARSMDGLPIEKNSFVTVKEINGNKLIVTKIKTEVNL